MKKLFFIMALAASNMAQASGKAEIVNKISVGAKNISERFVQQAHRLTNEGMAYELSRRGFNQAFIARNANSEHFKKTILANKSTQKFNPINLYYQDLNDDINLFLFLEKELAVNFNPIFGPIKDKILNRNESPLSDSAAKQVRRQLDELFRLSGLLPKVNHSVTSAPELMDHIILETYQILLQSISGAQKEHGSDALDVFAKLVKIATNSYHEAINKALGKFLNEAELNERLLLIFSDLMKTRKANQEKSSMAWLLAQFPFDFTKNSERFTKSILQFKFDLHKYLQDETLTPESVEAVFLDLKNSIRRELLTCSEGKDICTAVNNSPLFKAIAELADADPDFATWFDKEVMNDLF